MTDPVRTAYSLDELKSNARSYVTLMFGKPFESEDRDAWYARLGLLTDFVETMWHEMRAKQPSAGAPTND